MGRWRFLSLGRLPSIAILATLFLSFFEFLSSRSTPSLPHLRTMSAPALNKFNVVMLTKPYANQQPQDLHNYTAKLEMQEKLITLLQDMVAKPPNAHWGPTTEQDLVHMAKLLRQVNDINATHPEELNLSRLLFPFLKKQEYLSGNKNDLPSLPPVEPGSRGIVLAVGRWQTRFAAHLITSIREEFNLTDLPIQIMHAGADDLPREHMDYLIKVGGGDTPETSHLCFATDMTTVFNDDTVNLRYASYGVKPFAMLASSFEHTLFLDADAVFLQDPTWGFEFDDYKATGAYFFRDRLMYPHAFTERLQFYHDLLDGWEIDNPTNSQLNKSRVFMEGYAEEMDSGAVYLNKAAPGLKLALMFTCWMASRPQKEFVYNKFHGDKESYWIAFELLRIAYRFEERYAGVIGWDCTPKSSSLLSRDKFTNNRVCGVNILHMAAAPYSPTKLFWFNGSILPNYHAHNRLYFVPTHFMLPDQHIPVTWPEGVEQSRLADPGGKWEREGDYTKEMEAMWMKGGRIWDLVDDQDGGMDVYLRVARMQAWAKKLDQEMLDMNLITLSDD